MAAQKAIKTTYADGQTVWSNVRNNFGAPIFDKNQTITLTKVDTWYDGSPMDDTKVDGKVWLKMKSSQGGGYARVDLPSWGENFLEKDTVQSLRDMNPTEILMLISRYYKGVRLSGYYEEGDTPMAIDYYVSATSLVDDGGSVFEVGVIKLEHNFVGTADASYFGLKADGVTDNTAYVQQALLSVDNVILPKGDIVITNTVYVRAENTLTGQGSSNNANFGNTKIIFNPSSYIDLFATDGSKDPDLGYLFNIKFKNFSVTGNNVGRYLFNLPYMANFYAYNIKQFGGFHYFACVDGWLDCNFNECSSQGTVTASVHCILTNLISTNVRFNNCYFSWGDVGIITEYNSINSLMFNDTIFESFNKILVQGNLTNVFFNNYYSENTPRTAAGYAFEVGFGTIGSNVELEKPSLYINGAFSQGHLNISSFKSSFIKSNYAKIIKVSNIYLEFYENLVEYSANTNKVILDSVGGNVIDNIGLPSNNWDKCSILNCNMPYTFLDTNHPDYYYHVYNYNGMAKYREFVASPIGFENPIFIGEEALDIVNNKWYKSTGMLNTNWIEL